MTDTSTTATNKSADTTGNSNSLESWIAIPFKDQVFLCALRERDDDGVTIAKWGWCLQSTAIQVLARLPDANDMGLVCVYVPMDVETANVTDLLQRLTKVGGRKSFTVASMIVPKTAEDCLLTFGKEASQSNTFSSAQFKPVSVQ
jgi:hypothetical protein